VTGRQGRFTHIRRRSLIWPWMNVKAWHLYRWRCHRRGGMAAMTSNQGLAPVPPGRMTGAEFRSVHKRLCGQVPKRRLALRWLRFDEPGDGVDEGQVGEGLGEVA
jgi:hypothetical protein